MRCGRAAGLAAAVIAILLSTQPGVAQTVHWGYEGDLGPEHWGSLDPSFAACSEGRSQSPIDLRPTVLRDQRTQLTIKGDKLDLVGIRYWTRKVNDIAYVLRGASPNVVLMAHTPSRLIEASELGVPLMVSGHTHGGQIVLPGVGAIAAREYPVIAGIGQRQHTTAFVTRGVGTVYLPVRLNCPPEVAILTLKTPPVGVA